MFHDEILQYTIRRIRFKASRMVGKYGFTEDDFDDLRQELMQDVLERLPKFDSDRANIKIFISAVIDNRLASLIKSEGAQCRDYHCVERSLDEPAPGEDAEWTTFGESISEEEARSHLGRAGRNDHERADLAIDVTMVLSQLDEADRQLCIELQVKSPLDISREKGVRRSGIYERIAEIRKKFVQAGLRCYLPFRTDSSAKR
jgi:RNA polymerase sigma-70 factor (ECF subfamily)